MNQLAVIDSSIVAEINSEHELAPPVTSVIELAI